ncbi:MAG: hypothetical protein EOP88_12890 [Verrucomicrobiaceae bacterium]|nr:MAG: hypothetical protein EOP88_12890 [Verrucomicrobiaceae bacterium]
MKTSPARNISRNGGSPADPEILTRTACHRSPASTSLSSGCASCPNPSCLLKNPTRTPDRS